MSPLVSVCIPVYKPKLPYLQEALKSVFDQTFSDYEVIIRDDASLPDLTELKNALPKDDRISVHQGKERAGIGGNWNATWNLAKGKYIALLFQDDLWYPAYLQRCTEVLEKNPDVGFVACAHDYAIQDQTGAAATGVYVEAQDARDKLPAGPLTKEFFIEWLRMGLRPNIVGEPSFVVIRKSLLEKIGGFHKTMHQGLDTEGWSRMLMEMNGYWLSEKLGSFRVHAAGASALNEEAGRGMLDRIKTIRMVGKNAPDQDVRHAAKKAFRRESLKLGKRAMTRKTNHPIIQFVRYLFVGGSASVVDFATFAYMVTLLDHNLYLAAFVGYTAGFVWNHVLSVLWIFESRHSRKKEVMIAYSIAIGGLIWTELLLWVFADMLHLDELISRLIAMMLVIVWNYGMRKKFVFA